MKQTMNIPFYQPAIGIEEEQAVLETLRSGWITTGPRTAEFERRFAEYAGAQHAIAVSSCTAALHLSLLMLNLKPGEQVITTPFTFSATASEILHAGGEVKFVDVEPETGNINPDAIPEAVSEKTRAILPVHFAGQPCEMDSIIELALEYDLTVIEDAAHAAESRYKNQKIGCIGDFTCFSFYATKNLTTAEGGMVTCDNDVMAEKIRILSLHGMSKDAWKRYMPQGSTQKLDYYKILYQGYKYNMTDIQAALGIVQLERIESLWRRRDSIVQRYRSAFADMPEIELFTDNSIHHNARHLMVIKLNTGRMNIDRDTFILQLRERGIGASIHFISLHLHPFYQDSFGFKAVDFPVAADLSNRVVTLPLYPTLTDGEVDYVIDSVKDIIYLNNKKRLVSVE